MGDIVFINQSTAEQVERALDDAKSFGLDRCLVIGLRGNELFCSSSTGKSEELLYLVEAYKQLVIFG
jgi:hypothetical protein